MYGAAAPAAGIYVHDLPGRNSSPFADGPSNGDGSDLRNRCVHARMPKTG